ncbi:MAG: ribosome small subunit-dependent GTPase A [Bacteroidetes bacterium]|nr:ribosome small subunit-dependent GTPase A [Bacteroidota bacterium]
MHGIVIKSTGSLYTVRLEDGKNLTCRIRGNLRLKDFEATNPVTVGDKVEVEWDSAHEVGHIIRVFDRKNYIIRKSVKLSKQVQIIAANVDRAWVVATPVLPKTSLGFIDRFLATAEAHSVPAGILWNKADIYDDDVWDFVNELKNLYEGIGYKVLAVSGLSGFGLHALKDELKGKVNLFSGHSGVGKSSLINALIPGLGLKTSTLSSQHMKGTHTTTFAEMHALPEGGFLIDTPGIREFGTIDFDKYEVSHFFPDIFTVGKGCKFNNCLHTTEKDCAVKPAVERGEIAYSRYDSYLSILSNQDIFR